MTSCARPALTTVTLCMEAAAVGGSRRKVYGSRTGARGRHQHPVHRQRDPAVSVRLRRQPRHPAGQYVCGPNPGGSFTCLHRVPENAQQFSHRLGHQTLRPHSLRHRDRSPLRAIGALEAIRLTKAQSSVPQSCVNFLDFGINPWYKI